MKENDYIIVGLGLAGIAFCEQLIQNNKSFIVYDNNTNSSTQIAGGLYNPVVLKRFTPIWKANEQLEIAIPFYKKLQKKLNEKIIFELPLHRKLFSVEEQNNWFEAADKQNLKNFLSVKLIENQNKNINANFKLGQVNKTGYLDTKKLKNEYTKYLKKLNLYNDEKFEYNKLNISKEKTIYNNISTKQVVFCEGFNLKQNPYFNNLPLDGTKGELLIIKAENLNLKEIINSSIWILPLQNNLYKVGATYNWEDKTFEKTEKGKQELIKNLKELLNTNFEVIEHLAGIRPTVKDRKPLVGKHNEYKNLNILNGLGTRGVLFAPYLAKELYLNIEEKIELDGEINVARIYKKLFR